MQKSDQDAWSQNTRNRWLEPRNKGASQQSNIVAKLRHRLVAWISGSLKSIFKRASNPWDDACSQRIHELLATCIQTAVRRIFKYRMDYSLAFELARTLDTNGAISEIRKKLKLHQDIGNYRQRCKLAILEVALEKSPTGKREIWRVRWQAHESEKRSRSVAERSRVRNVKIREAYAAICSWGSSYESFMKELAFLYEIRRRELLDLNLPPTSYAEALNELEVIIMNAVQESLS